jgi:glutamate synthase domain-containing protein 3
MTGGRAVILGNTGRNFAAGMSGGVAYVLDEQGDFHTKCNMEMVQLEKLEVPEEIAVLKELIEEHLEYTGSAVAKRLLDDWDRSLEQFVKVMPTDYKRVLQKKGDLSVGVARPESVPPQDRAAGSAAE